MDGWPHAGIMLDMGQICTATLACWRYILGRDADMQYERVLSYIEA